MPIDVNYFYNKDFELQNSLKEIRKIVESKGGKCLDDIYISCHSRMRFECALGHIWETSSTNIKSGHWCHTCANKPITIQNAQKLANKSNGKCLSEEYINNYTHLKWQCKEGHIWEASYNAIQSGRWCPICSIKIRAQKKILSIDVYRDAAIKKGGKLLSTEYNGCYDKLKRQCGAGHIFEYRADQIKNTNKWCPICRRLLNENKKYTLGYRHNCM